MPPEQLRETSEREGGRLMFESAGTQGSCRNRFEGTKGRTLASFGKEAEYSARKVHSNLSLINKHPQTCCLLRFRVGIQASPCSLTLRKATKGQRTETAPEVLGQVQDFLACTQGAAALLCLLLRCVVSLCELLINQGVSGHGEWEPVPAASEVAQKQCGQG